MKKYLFTILFTFISIISFAQISLTQEQYNLLPQDVKDKIEQENTKNAIKSNVGWGKEIGIAINDTLIAIEDSATRISETKLGKTAIFIVVWKFLFRDILGILFAIIVLSFGIYSYFRVISKVHPDSDGYFCFCIFMPIIIFGVAALAIFV